MRKVAEKRLEISMKNKRKDKESVEAERKKATRVKKDLLGSNILKLCMLRSIRQLRLVRKFSEKMTKLLNL